MSILNQTCLLIQATIFLYPDYSPTPPAPQFGFTLLSLVKQVVRAH